MIAVASTLYSFFSGFGIPAYSENNIPKDAEPPYITYPLKEPDWNTQRSFYVNVYYRNANSELETLLKADEIVAAIGQEGRLYFPGGLLVLRPGNGDLIQSRQMDGDIRAAYINLLINAYHVPGV